MIWDGSCVSGLVGGMLGGEGERIVHVRADGFEAVGGAMVLVFIVHPFCMK